MGSEEGLWPTDAKFVSNVQRALSLTPGVLFDIKPVFVAQYMDHADMPVKMTDVPGRVLNRMQMELVAGRLSAVNECFY